MTNTTLAKSYLIKATKRMPILNLLLKKKAYSDVIREAQEIVELCLKGMLRQSGIEPPKWHDVGGLLVEYRKRFKGLTTKKAQKLAKISKALRKERELSFYGDIDFIPTEEYTSNDAKKAIKNTKFVFETAKRFIK
ncbi:MAG: HEPN domain-containing protein [candidate division WOR-3 bacterium]